MRLRVTVRVPGGETVTLDTQDGLWVEPDGVADHVIETRWGLPGLVDAHAHLARESLDFLGGDADGARLRATDALGAGVSLLIDKGWRDLTVIDLIHSVPVFDRPDIDAAGVILAVADGYWGEFARNVEPGGIEAAVATAATEGEGWVKMIGDWPRKGVGPTPNFSEDELAMAVRTAHSLNSRVAIHTMARDVPSMAVRAGVDSIEHGLFLTEDDLVDLGARGGAWVPTVLRVEAVIRQLGAESSGGRLLTEGLANVIRMLGPAVESGVAVLVGTDLAVGSHQVAAEAIRLWELGMSSHRVIESISASGLRANGRPFDFAPGAPANAVLFDEDPAADPRALAHPSHVIRLGRLVR